MLSFDVEVKNKSSNDQEGETDENGSENDGSEGPEKDNYDGPFNNVKKEYVIIVAAILLLAAVVFIVIKIKH